MKRVVVFSVLAVLALMMAAAPARAAIVIEKYTDPAAFKARLAGGAFPAKTVNFDGIAATKNNAVSFPTTKYRAATGMVITGEGGQYVSRAFRWPGDFVALSKPNMYAPGPVVWNGAWDAGGNQTDVTFSAGGADMLAAGFACYFIDADYPGTGPSSFTVYDGTDTALDGTGTVVTVDRAHIFAGLVAVDDGTDQPVAAIKRVHIVNGSGWLGNSNDSAEGCALDDFMTGTATYSVAGRVVHSGKGLRGVRITLKGAYTATASTNGTGRYTIRNVLPGVYTVTPKKKGYRFTPASRPATVVNANQTLARFRAR
jgi:hypothetical protein